MQAGIRIEGLREFAASLKVLEQQLPRELTKANKEAAALLAAEARELGISLGSVAAKAAETVMARASSTGGFVVGGAGAPYFFGAEFGAFAYKQFKGWRGNGAEAGYFVYPAIRANEERVVELYADRIEALARIAFPD